MYNTEDLFKRYPSLEVCRNDIMSALDILIGAAKDNKKILVCGNGGSASDSEHIVGELMKGFMLKRPLSDAEKTAWEEKYGAEDKHLFDSLQHGIKAISLPSQVGVLSAFCNDCEPDGCYAQLAYAYADEGDVIICLSTSGNSKNAVAGAKAASLKGASIISFTGEKESVLSEISDVCIKVPETETYKVQELHLPVYHCLCAALEEKLFG